MTECGQRRCSCYQAWATKASYLSWCFLCPCLQNQRASPPQLVHSCVQELQLQLHPWVILPGGGKGGPKISWELDPGVTLGSSLDSPVS